MAEYIDREDAIRAAEKQCSDGKMWGNENMTLVCPYEIIDRIYDLPAADVVPVKHSAWVKGGCGWECLDCGYAVLPHNNTKYCPNCGAIMDMK